MMRKPSIWLMLTLLMFPQIVETIYSPALGSIARHFSVSYQSAAQTLSVYFLAFAVGVVSFGVLADKIGRRPAMLLGLGIYGVATLLATQTENFTLLLILRALSAFGAAVGSIVTQTMLRDSYSGAELGQVFSLMGIGLGLSPVLGMFLGGPINPIGRLLLRVPGVVHQCVTAASLHCIETTRN
ncbi:MFS transporter [Ferrimonas aestuarii]|uniref:MFS transporter n=1 Tax=Ferrimonas aestuarii TaxID=2569539 RepID=UPI00269DBA82|nr:MFS transporter [Ferrimonas aestuarii]